MFDGTQRAEITALACEQTPDGYSHWALGVLANKAVELGICESISHKQVSNILKKRIRISYFSVMVYPQSRWAILSPIGRCFESLCACL